MPTAKGLGGCGNGRRPFSPPEIRTNSFGVSSHFLNCKQLITSFSGPEQKKGTCCVRDGRNSVGASLCDGYVHAPPLSFLAVARVGCWGIFIVTITTCISGARGGQAGRLCRGRGRPLLCAGGLRRGQGQDPLRARPGTRLERHPPAVRAPPPPPLPCRHRPMSLCWLRVTAWAACLVADRDVDHPFGKLEVFLWRELSGGTDQFMVRTFTHHHPARDAPSRFVLNSETVWLLWWSCARARVLCVVCCVV
jgi:hypothetical protein